LANTVPSNNNNTNSDQCDTAKNWWVVLMIGVVLALILGGCVWAGKSENIAPPQHAFGSGLGNLSTAGGILNDLEFL
jgi:type IV secretory pathway TrbF-like protein